MGPLFLHGGGGTPDALADTLGRFVAAARERSDGPILVVAHAEAASDLDEYREMLAAAGGARRSLTPVVVARDRPLTRPQLAARQPVGIFVCGGATPQYHEALCVETSWLDYARAAAIPYGGTSAGAAIAAERAIVGGWRRDRGGVDAAIIYQGASEGLDPVTVRAGLGLIAGSVEIHASQWGTLPRLLHAVDARQSAAGWAIDEDTMLEVAADRIGVWGLGQVYRVERRGDGTLAVAIYPAGATIARGE